MSGLKYFFLCIIGFQLSIYTFAQDNITLEAEEALNSFNMHLQNAIGVVTDEAPTLWDEQLSNISSTLNYYIQNDANEFRLVLSNITVIANTVDGGRDCIELLLHSSGLVANVFSSEQFIFDNLLSLAQVDISNSIDQYNELSKELALNCFETSGNCEGTSVAVILEVDRLLPKVKRIPLELLTEMHILIYQLAVDLEDAHTELMQIYNKATQNATLCVVSKVRGHKQELTTVKVPPDESLNALYEELVVIVQSANIDLTLNLLSNEQAVLSQTVDDYIDALSRVSTVISRVNETVVSLIGTAQDFNVTLNCTDLHLDPVYNSSFTRANNEFSYLEEGISSRVLRTVDDINTVVAELDSINLEIDGCPGNPECSYLGEKIVLKQSEIPWQLQQVTNSTIVLLQQAVTAVRESGARLIRDAQEQLEVGLLNLKSCIQNSL